MFADYIISIFPYLISYFETIGIASNTNDIPVNLDPGI